MDTAVKVAGALRQAVQPEGYNMWQSNGEAAGQEVPHVHFHLLTRSRRDGLLRLYPEAPANPPLEAMTPMAERLGDLLG